MSFRIASVILLVAAVHAQTPFAPSRPREMMEKGEGVCMDAIMSDSSPMNFAGKPYNMPGCFKTLMWPASLREAYDKCQTVKNFEDFMKNKENFKDGFVKMEECYLRELNMANGKDLDFDALDQFNNEVTGDQTRFGEYLRIYQECREQYTSASDSLVANSLMFKKCLTKGMFDFCSAASEDLGVLGTVLSMMDMDMEPKCTNLDVIGRTMPILSCRAKNFLNRMRNNPSMKFSMSRMDPKKMMSPKKMAEIAFSMLRSLGVITEGNELSTGVMVPFVRDLRDWTGMEKERDSILSAIRSCGMMSSAKLTDEEIAQRFPWVPKMPHVVYQLHTFAQCLQPKVSEQCGLKNQLSLLLNPGLTEMLPEKDVTEILGGNKDEMMDMFFKQIMNDVKMQDMDPEAGMQC